MPEVIAVPPLYVLLAVKTTVPAPTNDTSPPLVIGFAMASVLPRSKFNMLFALTKTGPEPKLTFELPLPTWSVPELMVVPPL